MSRDLERNIRAHDRVSGDYEVRHDEIYNRHEQARLRDELARAVGAIQMTGDRAPRALDFGAGVGNVTRHLIALGLDVTAADVSVRCLEAVEECCGESDRLRTFQLNGTDLRELADDSFEFASAYSVLHHIPDYLLSVRELARVVKPGGVVFLDHEVTEGFWSPSDAYREFRRSVAPRRTFKRFIDPYNYYLKLKLLLDPRYQPEGDIHVFADDHIEWPLIERVLEDCSFEIVRKSDYLLYRAHYPEEVWRHYASSCSDMRLLIARKRVTV